MAKGIFYGKGDTQVEVNFDESLYREACAEGCSVPQLLERKYEADTDSAKHGSVFAQLLAQNGMSLGKDKTTGLGSAKLSQIFDGSVSAAMTRDAVPASRILAPAAILEMVEINLAEDKSSDVAFFESMIGYNEGLNDDRFEQPIVDFSGSDDARSNAISQLALPNVMGKLTVAERQGTIPTFSLGLEISDKALKSYNFEFVAKIITRQATIEKAARVNQHINALVEGDEDLNMAALKSVKAKDFDASATGGKLTHRAYLKWLRRNRLFRTIDYVICDLDTYFSIVDRDGRPVADSKPVEDAEQMHHLARPINASLFEPQIYIVDDGVIPAKTIAGLDSRYAISRITNLGANYSAAEDLIMRRGSQMRFDFGEVVFRTEDKAWDLLSVA